MSIFYVFFYLYLFYSDAFWIPKPNISLLKNNYENNPKSLKINNLQKIPRPNKYTVVNNKHNIVLKYDNITNYFYDNYLLKNKKVLNIYPAGIKGFYEMGICTFIKENYNLENIVFSGASAGAWNSLLLSYKGNITQFKNIIFEINYDQNKSIFQLQKSLKKKILKEFSTQDFDLKKIFIGVTVLENFQFKTYIYTDFYSLEDALDCIIASSNIPFITGKLFYFYNNKLSFDGGFRDDPFIHHPYKSIFIHPSLFNPYNILNDDTNSNNEMDSMINDNHFIVDNNKFLDLFIQGYEDAQKYQDVIKKKLEL